MPPSIGLLASSLVTKLYIYAASSSITENCRVYLQYGTNGCFVVYVRSTVRTSFCALGGLKCEPVRDTCRHRVTSVFLILILVHSAYGAIEDALTIEMKLGQERRKTDPYWPHLKFFLYQQPTED
jgi:hypothetical protein